MRGLRKRLAHQRKRRQIADGRIATIDAKIRTRLIRLAQRPALAAYLAREFNLTFTSGWRSVQHNADVGGVPNSWHTKGSIAKPGAVDLVGTETAMQDALAWARGNVQALDESMIHTVLSGRHLHLGGWGVANWAMPQRGLLKKWRANRAKARKTSADATAKIAKLKRELTEQQRIARNKAIAREYGAHYVDMIFDSAEKHGVGPALALALFQHEASFINQYGHDRDRHGNIIWHGKTGTVLVTEENYKQYKDWRNAHGLAQGVGPGQLTSPGYQDQADARGGCWKPEVNIDVSLEILAGHIEALGTFKGVGAYNGGRGNPVDAYARSVLALRDQWRERLIT